MKYYYPNPQNKRKGFAKFRPDEWKVFDSYLDLCFVVLHDPELHDDDKLEYAYTPDKALGRNRDGDDTAPRELLGSLMHKRYSTLTGCKDVRADISKQQFIGFKLVVKELLGKEARDRLQFEDEGEYDPQADMGWWRWDPKEDLFD